MIPESKRGETVRPYPPPANVISLLKRLRSRNLPERINSEYLRDAGIPDGTNARTLSAMRFLGLIDEDEPSEALKSIANSTDEEYQTILSGLIRDAYHEVFSVVDPAQDTQVQILNVFRRYTPASQRDRMVIFFLGMCREASIPTLDVPRSRSMGAATSLRRATGTATKAAAVTPQRKGVPARSTAGAVAPALEGLIGSLPVPGTALSEERRSQWLKMAEATLEFLYPVEESLATTEQGVDTEEENEA